jgi:hypothetical protein
MTPLMRGRTRMLSAVVVALVATCWISSMAHAQQSAPAKNAPAKSAPAKGTPAKSTDAGQAATPTMKSEMIRIEYEPPKDPALQVPYKMVQERGALEMMQKVFNALRLPEPVLIRTKECGVSNAWYERVNKQPTVSICYEYLVEIWNAMPKEANAAGVTATDAVIGQLFFALAHEFGHAAFDIYDIPVFGHEEDAADQFATYIMLQFGGDRAHRLISGAAFSYREFVKNYKDKPNVNLPLLAFSSDHGSPEQRFYNLLCLAYGYDDKLFSDVVMKEYLPQTRARNCRYEYGMVRYAFRQLIVPHVNMDLAKHVMAQKWLDNSESRPVALR